MDNLEAVRNHVVSLKVQEALQCNLRLELRTQPDKPLMEQEREKYLTLLFNEIISALGIERFMELPAQALDQFAVMSVTKNHDTKGILVSLINSFITSYLTPETSVQAYKYLEKLESLKKEASAVHFERQRNSQAVQ